MARYTTNRSISVILALSLAVVMTSAMLFNGLKEAASSSEDQQQLQQAESKVIYTIYESINKNQIDNAQFKTDNSQFKRAPEFTDITGYLNTNPDLKLTDLKGKVVLVHFWTYTCINCKHTIPHLNEWYEKYADEGFIIIGVHSPEFDFEKDIDNVKEAVKDNDIQYPVIQDNNYGTWNAYGNQYWPRDYLIDTQGFIRYNHIGEGDYDKTEKAILSLLSEGMKQLR
jgi:thiol-disulfide isomerase/thioredoxin